VGNGRAGVREMGEMDKGGKGRVEGKEGGGNEKKKDQVRGSGGGERGGG